MTNKTISESSYVHPEVLVDTKWLEAHLHDQKLRIAEVNYYSSTNHELGHIPGAVLIDWKKDIKDINDSIRRDVLPIIGLS